jgi:hypothetical protein
VPNKPNSPGPAAQNKPNSRSAGYPQDSTMLSFHHSSSIPIAPNEANFARRPRTRETETCKTNPIRLIKSAKRTQFLGARGRLCKAKPIARSGAPRRCPAGAGRGVPCGTRGCCTNKPNLGCPAARRGVAVNKQSQTWASWGIWGPMPRVLYKQTQFGGTPATACRLGLVWAVCTNKPNSGGEGEAGAPAGERCETKPIPGRSAGTSGPVVQTKPIRRVDRATSPRCPASGNKANFHRSG